MYVRRNEFFRNGSSPEQQQNKTNRRQKGFYCNIWGLEMEDPLHTNG